MPEYQTVTLEETPYLYAERSCSMDPAEISNHMGSAFQEVWGFMQANGIAPAGPPMSVYPTYDPDTLSFRSGFPVAQVDLDKAEGGVKADVTPAGRVLHFTHKGPYATLRDDYDLTMQYINENSLTMGAPTWELYVNDPADTPEAELLTECYIALA